MQQRISSDEAGFKTEQAAAIVPVAAWSSKIGMNRLVRNRTAEFRTIASRLGAFRALNSSVNHEQLQLLDGL